MTAVGCINTPTAGPDGTSGEVVGDAPGRIFACSHCGLGVPPGLRRDDRRPQFCCNGCEAAYGIINSCGLSRYYALLFDSGETPVSIKSTNRTYAEYDESTFASLYRRSLPDDLAQIDLLLEGVHCSACVWLVEKLPRLLPGVVAARLDMRRAAVEVTYQPGAIALSKIARTLDRLGYVPHPARSPAVRHARRTADRKMVARIAVAGVCAGNIMLLFFALYAGMFDTMDRGHERLFRWVAMVLNLICLAWPGTVFGKSALAAIRARALHLDVPIALGLYLGGIWGAWKTVAATWQPAPSGASDIYFDSISALIFFLLIGRFLQSRRQQSAADAIEMLFSLTPTVARRVETIGPFGVERVTEVPVEALRPGDLVEVKAGDCIPSDGTIVDGSSSLDASLLTGESRLVPVTAGDRVAAGNVNIDSALRVTVEAIGESTRVGRLMRMVERASNSRPPIVMLTDRWGGWLLVALLGLAATTLVAWWDLGASIAIDRAIALLVATCPCGLGLATPLAMTVSIGRAAQRGILIKGGEAIQSLASARGGIIVLDKTGTITQGRFTVSEWIGDKSVRPLAAALESHSSHPIARAFTSERVGQRHPALVVIGVKQHAAAGIEGSVEGRRLLVGTLAFLRSMGANISSELECAAEAIRACGLSSVYVAADGVVAAIAGLEDAVRPEAADAIRSMHRRGWKTMMLSGDHREIVESVAARVGIPSTDCRAPATPEEKCAIIAELSARSTTVMVGDGVNDAAALASATVGIAVRGGAEASLHAADISMSREGLAPIIELLDGSRKTMRAIHWTIGTSIMYNVVAASLAITGLISPLLAAIIMPASSLTVVTVCLAHPGFASASSRFRGRSRRLRRAAEHQPPSLCGMIA